MKMNLKLYNNFHELDQKTIWELILCLSLTSDRRRLYRWQCEEDCLSLSWFYRWSCDSEPRNAGGLHRLEGQGKRFSSEPPEWNAALPIS
jgi:hypothetical protein